MELTTPPSTEEMQQERAKRPWLTKQGRARDDDGDAMFSKPSSPMAIPQRQGDLGQPSTGNGKAKRTIAQLNHENTLRGMTDEGWQREAREMESDPNLTHTELESGRGSGHCPDCVRQEHDVHAAGLCGAPGRHH
jgi:hypothetical protein